MTPEELLAGADARIAIEVPAHLLAGQEKTVTLQPLSIGVFQQIMSASAHEPGLIPILMVKESLTDPALSLDQARRLPLGLVTFLLTHIREISGLDEKKSPQGH